MAPLAALKDLFTITWSAIAHLNTFSSYLVLQVTHFDPLSSAAIDLSALELAAPVFPPVELFQVLPALPDRYWPSGDSSAHFPLSRGAVRRTDEHKVCQPARHLLIQRLGLFLPRIRLYKLAASARAEDAEALGPQCVDALGKACEEEVTQRGVVGAVAEECGEDRATWI